MEVAPQIALDVTLPKRLRARSWQFDGDRRAYPATAHGGLEIAWIEQGGVRYRIGRKTFDVGAGAIMLVPRGVEHGTEFHGAMRGGSVHLDDAVAAHLGHIEPGPIACADISVLGAMLLRELATAPHDLCAAALADALAAKAARSVPTAQGHDARVQRAIDIIRSRYAEPLDVDDIATACGTSRFELSRRMKSAVGKSPYQMLIDVRLEEAARLLRARRTVTDAAFSCGFSDLSRFAQMFKRKFGAVPSSYAA